MVRPTGGGGTRITRASLPSAQELKTILAVQEGGFGPRQTAGMAQITGMQFKGLPTAGGVGEFEELIPLFGAKDTMKYFDPVTGAEYNNYGEEPDMEDDSPAELSVVPTSTINPERPRTVAAGYDRKENKITVVFRDGTFYNYYQVSPQEWQRFKAVVSKGRFIMAYLDSKPRGLADVSELSLTARKAFYRFSRAAQKFFEGRPDKYGKPPKPKKP